MPPPREPTAAPLVGVWYDNRLGTARDVALALAAKGMLYEIAPVEGGWVLCVEAPATEMAMEEIALYEQDEANRPVALPAPVLEPLRFAPLIFPGMVMNVFFQVQQLLGERWTRAGLADGDAILHQGEGWRTITALTLHGDLGHFLANLLTGLTFAAFLQPQLGGGVMWLLVILTGALGNALNAWGYRGEPHYSLGASTAVFGALGLLVGCELLARWRSPATRSRWQLLVPLGAGFSLLAYLGVGEPHEHIDFMAHCWGFLCGITIGLIVSGVTQGRRAPAIVQRVAGSGALGLLVGAWWMAWKG